MLDFLERVLRRSFEVHRFTCPVEALSEARATRFDVLITDQKMPELTGLELLEQVAQLHPTTVRVLISGFTEVPEIAAALARSHIHNFVLKPIDAARLIEAVDAATERARA